jgi:NADH:ubiquinone oxidoreductase subunit 2 (subunit N)
VTLTALAPGAPGPWLAGAWPALSGALAALLAGLLLLRLERPGRAGIGPAGTLVALAASLALAPAARAGVVPLLIALVIAALARDGDELLHGECALKLLWVMGSALALSWAGQELLTLATGTPYVLEQWSVLGLGLDPEFLWSTALPLSLLIGVVLLGGAPFHFWLADVCGGARPWLAPLAVATLQACGAAWLVARLHAVESFAPGAGLALGLLRMAAVIAFLGGAATLLSQRRPERRVGTLASLNGALVLALVAAGREPGPGWIMAWASHQALALTGAGTMARLLPVSAPAGPGAPLMRRHGAAAIFGLLSLFSLAGLPGTPGGRFWFEAAQALGRAGHRGMLLALGIAWLAALWRAVAQLREAYGVPGPRGEPVAAVPAPARAAITISGLGVGVLALVAWLGR